MKQALRKTVKKALQTLGLWEPTLTMPKTNIVSKRPGLRNSLGEVMDHLQGLGFTPKTVFDIGFNTGTPGLYDHFTDAHYVLVDPLKANEIFMQDCVSRIKRGDYVVAAAGDGSVEEITIAVTPDFGGSSAYLKSGDLQKEVAPVVTLDALEGRFSTSGPYLIKIDVQGAELDVLRGAKQVLAKTEVVIAEARFFPFGGAPEIGEVLKFLDEQGFALFDLFNVARRPSDEALGQIDIVAVRKDGFFRNLHQYKSSKSYRTPEQRKRNIEGKLKKREAVLKNLKDGPQPPA
jgi:FkbM family methyltransferase